MSDSEDRQSPPQAAGRHEKSLGLLTTKFVELLQTAEGGILDLKKVRNIVTTRVANSALVYVMFSL